jgi:DNA primase
MGYKSQCPECLGKNLYITPHNGLEYCFNCGYTHGTGEYTPRTRFEDIRGIREFYTDLAIYYHGCLDTAHVEYLHARGITDDAISRYGIGYCPNSTHVLYTNTLAAHAGMAVKGMPFMAGRIVFPYWYDGYVTDIRGRAFDCVSDKKYLSPRKDAFYRGADYPYNAIHLDLDAPLVITEGEIKAIAAGMAGIPTIALPGIQSMRPKIINRYGKNDIVCFDTQSGQARLDIRRAIFKLHDIIGIRVATLPELKGKGEIDTHILAYGPESFKRIVSRALEFNLWKKLSQ